MADASKKKSRTFRKFSYRGIDLDQLLELSTDQVSQTSEPVAAAAAHPDNLPAHSPTPYLSVGGDRRRASQRGAA